MSLKISKSASAWSTAIAFGVCVFQVNFLLTFREVGQAIPEPWQGILSITLPLNAAIILISISYYFLAESDEESDDSKGPGIRGKKILLWAKRVFASFAISFAVFFFVAIFALFLGGNGTLNALIDQFYPAYLLISLPFSFFVAYRWLE